MLFLLFFCTFHFFLICSYRTVHYIVFFSDAVGPVLAHLKHIMLFHSAYFYIFSIILDFCFLWFQLVKSASKNKTKKKCCWHLNLFIFLCLGCFWAGMFGKRLCVHKPVTAQIYEDWKKNRHTHRCRLYWQMVNFHIKSINMADKFMWRCGHVCVFKHNHCDNQAATGTILRISCKLNCSAVLVKSLASVLC